VATAVFWVAAAVAVLGALGVVVSRQPIRSVLSLVVVMLALSVLFLLLSAQFVFAVQIIVYAGAVMVLFLFVVALLGPIKESAGGRLRLQFSAALIAVAILAAFLWALLRGVQFHSAQGIDQRLFGSVEQIGVGLFTTFLYPFELTSVLLLVAAVGAVYLSRADRGGPR